MMMMMMMMISRLKDAHGIVILPCRLYRTLLFMAALRSTCGHYIFLSRSYFFLSFFLLLFFLV